MPVQVLQKKLSKNSFYVLGNTSTRKSQGVGTQQGKEESEIQARLPAAGTAAAQGQLCLHGKQQLRCYLQAQDSEL